MKNIKFILKKFLDNMLIASLMNAAWFMIFYDSLLKANNVTVKFLMISMIGAIILMISRRKTI